MLQRHAAIALLIVALALGVRALVPAGYMTSASPTGLTVELCSGVAGKTVTIALPSQGEQHHGKAQVDSPCGYAALGQTAIAAIDPILLVIAIAFVMVLGLRLRELPRVADRTQLRPPLRGPPLEA